MYSVGDKVVHPMHGAGTIEEIKENDYDLSINKYKEVIYEKIEYRNQRNRDCRQKTSILCSKVCHRQYGNKCTDRKQ